MDKQGGLVGLAAGILSAGARLGQKKTDLT
jgi:hypothetical protein